MGRQKRVPWEWALLLIPVSLLLTFIVSRHPYGSSLKDETISNQDRLVAAIDAYCRAMSEAPPDVNDDASHVPERNMAFLMKHLFGQAATDANKAEEIARATREILGGDPTTYARDAWGNTMIYFRDGGLGCKPVIISAGPDGEFGFARGGKEKRRDNIRSDTRE